MKQKAGRSAKDVSASGVGWAGAGVLLAGANHHVSAAISVHVWNPGHAFSELTFDFFVWRIHCVKEKAGSPGEKIGASSVAGGEARIIGPCAHQEIARPVAIGVRNARDAVAKTRPRLAAGAFKRIQKIARPSVIKIGHAALVGAARGAVPDRPQ